MTVKLSIGTPIVTLTPGGHGKWEDSATIEDLERWPRLPIGSAITTSLAASRPDAVRGVGIHSPRSATLLLSSNGSGSPRTAGPGYHHPLEIAKRYGTNGTVILGVGVGTLKEEFDLLGAPFDNRGPRVDDARLVVDASAVQDTSRSGSASYMRSLRRAVNLAEGWCPFAVAPAQVEHGWGRLSFRPTSKSCCHRWPASTRSTNRTAPRRYYRDRRRRGHNRLDWSCHRDARRLP